MITERNHFLRMKIYLKQVCIRIQWLSVGYVELAIYMG